MTDENNKLAVKIKPPTFGGIAKKGIAANRDKYEKTMKQINPLEVPNRLGLIMDDSGSMGSDGMDNAHKAIAGFLDACNYQDTSVCVYPLNAAQKPLLCDYDVIKMYVNGIGATGGTPIYTTLGKMIESESITRGILFSDGSPTDSSILSKPKDDSMSNEWSYVRDGSLAHKVVDQYIKKEISIDTIFIGYGESKELQELARLTGGTYLHFTDINTLRKNLKYLAPKYVALLANAELKAKIERGETI